MRTVNGILLFYSNQDIYSNWYPARFRWGGIDFTSAEQYMMYEKAMFFGDTDIAAQILATDDCRAQKTLGRRVKNYDETKWVDVREYVVWTGLVQKFRQNPDLQKELVATDKLILAEASPWDRIWGIGLPADDIRAHKQETWQGQNLLGKALMNARAVM